MNTTPLSEEMPFLALRSTWQPVINSADLPRGGVGRATLLGEELVVARFQDGTLLAAQRDCPHKGYDLSKSRICENQTPREVPVNPVKGGWGVLVSPGDTLANTFQKTFRRWLSSTHISNE